MTLLDIRELPQTAPSGIGSDITHEACCLDEEKTSARMSMRGLNLPDGVLDADTPDCVVCQSLLEQWAHYADVHGEDPHRPGDAPCRLCPRLPREGAL